MIRALLPVVGVFVSVAATAENGPPTTSPASGASQAPSADSTAAAANALSTRANNLFGNVDILAEGELLTPAIWAFQLDLGEADLQVQKQIEEKKFANDEYYMRNIDREEFEQERIFLLFEEQTKAYETYLKQFQDDDE
jgi:hypothetical protein